MSISKKIKDFGEIIDKTGDSISNVFIDESKETITNTPPYIVRQVVLKEKFVGKESKNLSELEEEINTMAYQGYRLHTCSVANGGSAGLMGGDRLQATLIFEKI